MRYGIITYMVITLTAFAALGTTDDAKTDPKNAPSDVPTDTDILNYLKLNNEALRGFPDNGPQKGPEYITGGELNSFATVSLAVDVNKAANLKELLEKIQYPYIIRAQVKGKNVTTDVWQTVVIFNAFTRVLAKEMGISSEVPAGKTEPAGNGGTSAESAGAQVEAPGPNFMAFELKPETYDEMKYLKTEKYVTVIDPWLLEKLEIESGAQEERGKTLVKEGILGVNEAKLLNQRLYSGPPPRPTIDSKTTSESGRAAPTNTVSDWKPGEIEAVTVKLENILADPQSFYAYKNFSADKQELIDDTIEDTLMGYVIIEGLNEKKEFLETEKDVFFFNAANCYISDNDGNIVHYKAKEGDTLRIQIFRVVPLLTDGPDAKPTIPELKHELYFTFREYGWFANVSPANFYVAHPNRNNFNALNFNPTKNTPGIGANVYFTYVGTSKMKDILVNWVAPSLAFALVGYYDKPTETADGINGETTEPKKNEVKFAAGLSWPVIPIVPWLRDMVNLSVLIYDLDFDHVLVGISFSPKFNFSKLFNKNKDERLMDTQKMKLCR